MKNVRVIISLSNGGFYVNIGGKTKVKRTFKEVIEHIQTETKWK